MTKKASAEDTMIALHSALSECMESYEFMQAILEGDKSVVFINLEDWYITYVHNKDIGDDSLIVDLPVLTDEVLQRYEEIEVVDRRDRDAFISAIKESGCIDELQEAMYQNFQDAINKWAQLMADRLTARLQNSPYIIRPIEARLEARVVLNGVDMGDLLTLYRHLQDEHDFLGWLQGQLKDAKPTIEEEIRQALWRLTALRKRVVKANDTAGRLFASLVDQAEPLPTHSDLDQAVRDLESQVPGYHVWFEPRHGCYALIPKTDLEL
jgi:hypothetical protein